jgi:flagellar protein FlaJ
MFKFPNLLDQLSFLSFFNKNKKVAKPIKREVLDMDFFSLLSYMSAISSSGISRAGLFQHASKLPYVSSGYFKKVDFVAKAFNHDYAEACRIVGEATKEPEVKAVLLRLSGALASGEELDKFLAREARVFGETYSNSYAGRLELLKKWTDAYIALIMTSAVVTVMAVVTAIIGNITVMMIMSLCSLTILVTIGGVWLIANQAPKEKRIHNLPIRSKEQELGKNLSRVILPLGFIVTAAVMVIKHDLGWAMLTASAFLFPVGIIGFIDDAKIYKRDTEIAGFLRSVGGVSQAIRATVSEAMGRLDFRSMGTLRENVDLLYTRLRAGISPSLCWNRFVCESGSEQVNRSVRIFWDGVTLGGEPEKVGNEASAFSMQIAHLREQRKLISNGLLWLAIAMHIVLTIVVVFIDQTIVTFCTLVKSVAPGTNPSDMLPGLQTFGIFGGNSMEINMLHFMVIIIVLVLTVANAVAVHATDGGHINKLALYLAITLAFSGAALVFVPPVVNMMLVGMGK